MLDPEVLPGSLLGLSPLFLTPTWASAGALQHCAELPTPMGVALKTPAIFSLQCWGNRHWHWHWQHCLGSLWERLVRLSQPCKHCN